MLSEHSRVDGQQSCRKREKVMKSWVFQRGTWATGLLFIREEAVRGRNKEARLKEKGLCSFS